MSSAKFVLTLDIGELQDGEDIAVLLFDAVEDAAQSVKDQDGKRTGAPCWKAASANIVVDTEVDGKVTGGRVVGSWKIIPARLDP